MKVSPELIESEKRRIRRVGVAGALFPIVPLVVVVILQGRSPWMIPYYHLAIPILLLCVSLLFFLMMPLVDGVLVLGRPRLSSARAALLVRAVLTNLMGVFALWVLFHSRQVGWFAVFWGMSILASLMILQRIGAYQAAFERIARDLGKGRLAQPGSGEDEP